MHRLSWKETKKYRQTFSEASADAAWAAFFSWHRSSAAASLYWSALQAASREAESKLGRLIFQKLKLSPEVLILIMNKGGVLELVWDTCDARLIFKLTVTDFFFILPANQVWECTAPLAAACLTLGCRGPALYSVNRQRVGKMGREQL